MPKAAADGRAVDAINIFFDRFLFTRFAFEEPRAAALDRSLTMQSKKIENRQSLSVGEWGALFFS
jgi:hypothetical protein